MTTTARTHHTALTTGTSPRVGKFSALVGVIAAALTTILSLISLVLGPIAIVLAVVSVRRGERRLLAAIGATAAVVSVYVILLEILALGG